MIKLKHFFDGSAFVNESGEKVYKFITTDGKKYIIGIKEGLGRKYAMGDRNWNPYPYHLMPGKPGWENFICLHMLLPTQYY